MNRYTNNVTNYLSYSNDMEFHVLTTWNLTLKSAGIHVYFKK